MKKSQRWFEARSAQDVRSRVSTLPLLAKAGPNATSEPKPDSNAEGKGYFKVGKSIVGGEEVVG